MDTELIQKLTLVKKDLEMILDSGFDYHFVTNADNINSTLNNVKIALEIAKELQIKNTNL